MARRRAPPLPVLAEGPGWVVVAKPPGMLVHRAELLPGVEVALQVVRDQVGRYVYPIHRLDRQASGCLLFATDPALAGPLSAALASPDAQKTYLAFVRGHFAADAPVVVDTPMKDDNGIPKEALSVVICLGRSREPRCSLLRVEPRTGRYHQVRRHVRDLHHPILGDADHGDSKVNREWRETRGNYRLGLHAARLSLPLPDGGRIEAECPIFADHARIWSTLPWWDEARATFPLLDAPALPLRYPDAPFEARRVPPRARWRPGSDPSRASEGQPVRAGDTPEESQPPAPILG